jgi:hypothetical protein
MLPWWKRKGSLPIAWGVTFGCILPTKGSGSYYSKDQLIGLEHGVSTFGNGFYYYGIVKD